MTPTTPDRRLVPAPAALDLRAAFWPLPPLRLDTDEEFEETGRWACLSEDGLTHTAETLAERSTRVLGWRHDGPWSEPVLEDVDRLDQPHDAVLVLGGTEEGLVQTFRQLCYRRREQARWLVLHAYDEAR